MIHMSAATKNKIKIEQSTMSKVKGDLVFLMAGSGDCRPIPSPIPIVSLENVTRDSGANAPVMMVPSQDLSKFVTDSEHGAERKNGDERPQAHSNSMNQVDATF